MEYPQTPLSPEQVAAIIATVEAIRIDLDDCEVWSFDGIHDADKLTGAREEDVAFFGHRYIDQKAFGEAGDSFYGTIYYPVGEKYLRVWYSC